MSKSEEFWHEWTVQIIWMVDGWRKEYNWNEGNDEERLKYDESDRDNRGELANLLLLLLLIGFVMYRIYVQWKRGRSRTINNKIRREMIGDIAQDDSDDSEQ